MRFHLVYRGPLKSTGNEPKPKVAAAIRAELSPQLAELWRTHSALQALAIDGYSRRNPQGFMVSPPSPWTPKQEFERHGDYGRMIDLCEEIPVGDKRFKPLVRKSLNLNCELEILFLRQEDPGSLVLQGGDLDNRIKTLFDALRMPSRAELEAAPQVADMLYCLMESDSLVAGLDVSTDRLLFPETDKADEVHLVIAVSLRVLTVTRANACLL